MMDANGKIKRYRRFSGWDYAKGASLFITIATESRRAILGKVQGGAVALSTLGEKVKEAMEAIPRLNPGILIFGHVVMPDHVHFNCAILLGLPEPLKVLGNAIRRFKNYTTKLANGHLWQQGYHDYILLSRDMIDATERYIAYNPMKWELMYGEEGALRVIEPIFLPRLDAGDYWKGVGNLALLDPGEKLLSLRISREVQGAGMAKVLARIENAVSQGYIIIKSTAGDGGLGGSAIKSGSVIKSGGGIA